MERQADWQTSDGQIKLWCADCLEILPQLDECSIDSVVTDPPYGLEFMGKEWDRPWQSRGENPASAGMSKGGFSNNNGYANRETPAYGKAWTNKRCIKCGHIASGGSPCKCDEPEFIIERGSVGAPMRAFQSWCETWAVEAFRVLKPGGHLLAFGGSRTYHRLASAIEDAGFEIRDCIMWMYGSGFPKSLDVSKAIDKAAGAERERIRGVRSGVVKETYAQDAWSKEFKDSVLSSEPITDDAAQWNGWGTALKPAHEPIVVARKPLSGTVAANVLQYGTGALNIEATRIGTTDSLNGGGYSGELRRKEQYTSTDDHPSAVPLSRLNRGIGTFTQPAGRWPANVIHDGSEEATAGFPESDGQQGYVGPEHGERPSVNGIYGDFGARPPCPPRIDTGSAARFFYCAKADASERRNSKHPTVKPLALMQYLVRLVTPPNGTVLDLFMGSGTTIEAAFRENFKAIGIEREAAYFPDCIARLEANRSPLFDPVAFEPAPSIIQHTLPLEP